jgi:GDP-4-dehydro-6-deoxy-D-mannose reductase
MVRTILVTGASGFVGQYLLAHLRTIYPDAALHGTLFHDAVPAKMFAAASCKPYQIDIRDPQAALAMLEALHPDRIFHLAGQAFVPQSFKAPWDTLETNLRGALNLLEGVRILKLESRVLIIGSAEVYGILPPEQMPIREDYALRPVSPYGVSKSAQDMLAYQYAKAHGVHTVRVRPFNHIGPGQSNRFAAADWAKQIAEAELGKRQPQISVGDTSSYRDFTDVRDVVRAYALLMEHAAPGDAFNICSGHPKQMQSVLDILLSFSRVPIEVQVDPARLRPSEIPSLYGDPGALQKCTGWQPEIPLEESLADILEDARTQAQTQPF